MNSVLLASLSVWLSTSIVEINVITQYSSTADKYVPMLMKEGVYANLVQLTAYSPISTSSDVQQIAEKLHKFIHEYKCKQSRSVFEEPV